MTSEITAENPPPDVANVTRYTVYKTNQRKLHSDICSTVTKQTLNRTPNQTVFFLRSPVSVKDVIGRKKPRRGTESVEQ